MKKHWIILAIFIFAFLVRFLSVWPANTIIGFDQARDLFDSVKILNGDLRIIGPTAGNNPNLHHGVLWLYFMTIPLIFSHNPIYVVLWNALFNALSAVVMTLLAKDLFNSKKVGITAGIITAVSYYYVSFSAWLSNPTMALFTVPVFFFGIWKYYQKKNWGLPLSLFFLGLSIQSELFLIYLIPIFIILWLILKPKLPDLKNILLSLFFLLISLSTIIATEIKFRFAGILNILMAGKFVGETHTNFIKLLKDFLINRWEAFYLNLWPQNKEFGIILGLITVSFFIFEIIKNKKNKEIRTRNLFLLIWLYSPIVMLILGTHNAPWFLIGRQAAGIIMVSYLITKFKPKLLIVFIIIFFIYMNLKAIINISESGQILLEPDKGSLLSKQIAIMKYTYEKAKGESFSLDTVTNPLYINAVWAWNFNWYGKNIGYKPSWLGGDQLEPYNTLNKATGKEKYMFLIIDETPRIPPVYKNNAIFNLKKIGKLMEEKSFDGTTVMTFTNTKN